ncbi:hypothetical protein E4633_07315 [Geomonas terrae]|uniref:STAS/SEC14 domain-containing protein n=1 Tax=Geomonas terrae TaxID=2562681 RepID=A0A4S1CF65_9BACT|nr:hypothetical protein [Geomonas terrae]TGU72121.1 hypothetical protein E4633_07315 [Geomonas terrae]
MATVQFEQLTPDTQVFHVTGTIGYKEFLDIISNYGPKVTRHLIWDFNNADISALSGDEMRALASILSTKVINRTPYSKSAFVASRDLTFGMSHMYTAIVSLSGIPYLYSAFRTVEHAIKWIESETDL